MYLRRHNKNPHVTRHKEKQLGVKTFYWGENVLLVEKQRLCRRVMSEKIFFYRTYSPTLSNVIFINTKTISLLT